MQSGAGQSESEVQVLDVTNAVEHLRRRGLASGDDVALEELGGGVSNVVLRYTPLSGGAPGVLKQPRRRLRVPFEWICPLERAQKELRCLTVLERRLAPGTVPTVVDYDPDRYILAMTCAPHGSRPWKEDLLAGTFDPAVAEAAAALLAQIHRTVGPDDPELAELDDPEMLRPLRIDPYYLPAAAANPAVATQVHAAARRLADERRTVVLGDFVPKNILVGPGPRLTIIDFEVAHYGDPAYDAASCLNHLLLKATAFPEHRSKLAGLARVFWRSYERDGGPAEEDWTLLQLGALQLARVDGLSPVEYLSEASRAQTRAVAHAVLERQVDTVDAAIALVERLG